MVHRHRFTDEETEAQREYMNYTWITEGHTDGDPSHNPLAISTMEFQSSRTGNAPQSFCFPLYENSITLLHTVRPPQPPLREDRVWRPALCPALRPGNGSHIERLRLHHLTNREGKGRVLSWRILIFCLKNIKKSHTAKYQIFLETQVWRVEHILTPLGST